MQDERQGLGSGSGYARDKRCPANRKMANKARELGKLPVPSECVEKGTKGHEWLALDDPIKRAELELDEETLETVFTIEQQKDIVVAEFRAAREPGRIVKEQRFWLYKGITAIRTSKPDYVETIIGRDGLDILILDYKTGHAELEGEEADGVSQLEEYALTVAVNLSGPQSIKRVRAHLLSRWKRIVEREYFGAELQKIHRELLLTIQASNAENPAQVPGWYCKYCDGRLICPSAQNEIVLVDAKPLSEPLPEGEEGAKFIDQVRRVKSLSEEILAHYRKRLTDNPGCCGTYRIGEGAKTREIMDIPKAYELLVEGMRMSPQEFMESCAVHIGQLEKKFCNHSKETQRRAKKEFNELLDGVIQEGRKTGSLEKASLL